MFTTNLQTRVQEILDFIGEITLGNYTYTLPLRNRKDELEQIVLSLNTMVEEIDTTVHRINHEKSSEVVLNLVFNLDSELQITSYSRNVSEVLRYSTEEVLHKPIHVFLGEGRIIENDPDKILEPGNKNGHPFEVEFKHANGYSWRGKAYLHPLFSEGKDKFSLSVFRAVSYNEKIKIEILGGQKGTGYPTEYRSLLLREQRELTRRLHKYVMKRLDRKLKSLSVISREVGGSVSKIKAIFKETYGDTIYSYHLRKRLDKAHLLLQNTNLPINEIAEECGFSSFPHFSRSFKKEFGITPSQVRKF